PAVVIPGRGTGGSRAGWVDHPGVTVAGRDALGFATARGARLAPGREVGIPHAALSGARQLSWRDVHGPRVPRRRAGLRELRGSAGGKGEQRERQGRDESAKHLLRLMSWRARSRALDATKGRHGPGHLPEARLWAHKACSINIL